MTKGVGRHKEKLASFEMALRDAGIKKCNIVHVSSIFPPNCELISRNEGAKYIFEPSLETIVIFFETEIFSSLLEQVFHESRLAKLASRMVLLDRASVAVAHALARTVSKRSRL